jgi:hypothetical protein
VKILLDEQTPIQFESILSLLLPAHTVVHVQSLSWKGKGDVDLLRDAKRRGYSVFVTNDRNQLSDPNETRAIRKSGLHHVTYKVPSVGGMKAIGRALGSLAASMPLVVEQLDGAVGQRLVSLTGLSGTLSDRCRIIDPRKDPPRYWR